MKNEYIEINKGFWLRRDEIKGFKISFEDQIDKFVLYMLIPSGSDHDYCSREVFKWDAYDMYDMLGTTVPAIMAHVVHPTDVEYELLKKRNVTVAHCPASNMNAAGGVCRVLDMVRDGIKVGLGTDVAGSCNLSVMRAMTDAIQASKLRWVYTERNGEPLC